MAAWVLVHQYRLRAILRRSFLLCPRGGLSPPVFRLKGEKNNSTQTTYHRQIPATRPKKYGRDENASDKESIEKQPRSPGMPDVVIRDVDRNVPFAKPPTFLSQLKIYNGTFTDDSVWKIFFRPLPFVLSPVVRSTACDDFPRTALPKCHFGTHPTDVVRLPGLFDANSVVECAPRFSALLSVGGGPLTPMQVWSLCAPRRSSPSSMTSTLLKLYVFRA